jgi:predicted AAA+ superfamily ATPase
MISGKIVRRDAYMDKIKPLIGKPFIKVISGIRRSGKSSILKLLREEFAQMTDAAHIFYLNFDDFEFSHNMDAARLHSMVKDFIKDAQIHYIMLDEIQLVPEWERVVISLFESQPVDIYITGSNSKLLASELSTLLSGRFVGVVVYPLSFREYRAFKKATNGTLKENTHESLWDYIEAGGFPALHISDIDNDTALLAVKDIYASVLLRDTIQRFSIRNIGLLENLLNFIFENTENAVSAKSIAAYMKNQGRRLDTETVYNYLNALESAYIIQKVGRYDINGKELLNFYEKYYPTDVSLTYAAFGFDMKHIAGIIETLIFNELKRHDWNVYIGKSGSREIDFIGIKGDQKIYIQACYLLADNTATIEREFRPLFNIKDNFPKYVVSMDERWSRSLEGVQRIHLADFLLGDYV